MKKGRFLWSAYRITEKQKAGKAQNIKEKQLQNSRNTVSKVHAVLPSSPRDNRILVIYAASERMLLFLSVGLVGSCNTAGEVNDKIGYKCFCSS